MKTNATTKMILVFIAILAFLLGGAGITAAAARAAIPGDALYPVKTGIEQTRLSLAQDAGNRAQMKLAFAEQRLDEIGALIREGRYREIDAAVLAFEANINAAIIELESVAASDPARAAAIAQEVTSALSRYAQTLSVLAAAAPESVRSEVNRALDTTNIASGLGAANDNANANSNDDNANSNDDNGNDDNANSNDDNGNDDNANSNDDNGNDDNANSNDDNGNDDNGNDDNANSNDDNGNGDNGNSNDDSGNANINDDNGNDDNGNDDNANSNDDNSNDDNGNDDNGGNDNGNDHGGGGSNDNGNDDSSGKGGGDDYGDDD